MSRAAAILKAALPLQGRARAAYLDQACANDAALRREIDALLLTSDKTATAHQTTDPAPGPPDAPTVREDRVDPGMAAGPVDSLRDPNLAYSGGPTMPIRFGDYELLEEIARGGMGVVWKARQLSLNRTVALKMILSGQFADEAEVRRFRNEAQAAARLQHPNIVAIHEIGIEQDRHFFTMDYVAGRSLAVLLQSGPFPPERAARYVRAVARAIEAAHHGQVLHRDLKPSNVLIDLDDQPRITDFGIGRLETDRGLTRTGAALGTPSYMPPEQAAGRHDRVGPLSDVYSMGAILYELLTGRPPFQAATVVETLRQVLETEPAPPRWINPNIPEELDTICLKCLEKEPARRYGSAKTLADDLDRFLRHEPIVARPATLWERTRKWARRKPAQALLVSVSTFGLLAFVMGALWYQQRLDARLFDTLMEQARAERLLGHRDESLAKIAAAAAGHLTPALRAEAIQSLALPGIRRVFATNVGTVATTRFSRNGAMVAVGTDYPARLDSNGRDFILDTRVMVFDSATGAYLGETPWGIDNGGFAFSKDDSVLAVPQGSGSVTLWSPRDGRIQGQVPVSGTPSFSPDGKLLAITSSNRLVIYSWPDLRPGRTRLGAVTLLAWLPDAELLLQEASQDGPGQLWRWHSDTGAEVSLTSADEAVLATSADGRVGILGKTAPMPSPNRKDDPGTLEARDLGSGRVLLRFPASRNGTFAGRLSEDGGRLIYPDLIEPGRMRVWDVFSDQFLIGLGEPTARLSRVFERPYWRGAGSSWEADFAPSQPLMFRSSVDNFGHDGSLLAIETWGTRRDLALWEADSGRRWATLPDAGRPVWSPDDHWLAVTGKGVVHAQIGKAGLEQDGNVALEIWEVNHNTPMFHQSGLVSSLTYSSDGRHLAAGRNWWEVHSNGANSMLRLTPLRGNYDEQIILGRDFAWWLPDRKGGDEIVAVRQLAPEAPPVKLGRPGFRLGTGLSPDGRHLLIAFKAIGNATNEMTAAGHFELWNLPEQRLEAVWPHLGPRYQTTGPIEFSPDGRRG
jgi:WD40 repeat protein